ncbi:MAG: hypothetical protein IPI39_01195 [Candidatus Obscuribacter sp.]|nr:hypothetical protein [Candidatus Obscuribacter sp.]
MQPVFTQKLSNIQPTATRLLGSALTNGRMAHAFLLTGRDKASKWIMARQLAAFLNCLNPQKEALGACIVHDIDEEIDEKRFEAACQNCRWLYKDEHPKAWYVLSNESGKSGKIPVEAARNLSEEPARTSNYVRIVVIEDASEGAFHRPAANALLKTIEEPRSSCLFLLFASAQDDVLTTIVSRCQVVPFLNRLEDNLGLLNEVGLGKQQPVAASVKGEKLLQSEMAKKLSGENFLLQKDKGTHANGIKDALSFAHGLYELIEDEGDGSHELIIDTALALEISRLAKKGSLLSTASGAAYAQKLLIMSEEAKRRFDQYVSKKPICESFVLSWHELRQKSFI